MAVPQDHVDATELVARALAPYGERPGPEGVAALTDGLITCGQKLHDALCEMPSQQRPVGAFEALAEWEYFAAVGPLGSGPHANWNHARGLARIIRQLMRALEHAVEASAS
ncbi:hypothetical protein HYE82_03190 [Streptomyces sp. BR123]|uniref:DUF6415 family natural product biosynthesis protein n=1 Tax=Streptomyces sp. BR123 TaxID=2749828 RepID=UPI0015C419AA|nr:DUF6415 family natural product biosynthesis protein [Streptomyces sp. BR123]NXY93425.1 hypothetical protein [Streptomyces sp. BR123]